MSNILEERTLESELVRITVVDDFKMVTLPGDALLTRQMTAACASDPESLEDMLLATEPLRPGVTRRVINALLHFDHTRNHDAKLGPLLLDPATAVFEALDARMQTLCLQGLSGGLAVFDLSEKIIYCAAPALSREGAELKREDELPVVEKGEITRKTVTYSLDKSWKVLNLASSPEMLASAYRKTKKF